MRRKIEKVTIDGIEAERLRERLKAHAAACRAAMTAGCHRPRWEGGILRDTDLSGASLSGAILRDIVLAGANLRGASLYGADLRGADLRGADLTDTNIIAADLRGADLTGATIAECVVAAAVAGEDGGYMWHALRLESGSVVLRYGCDRATLDEWLQRGPGYGAKHDHPPEHWSEGPAVAIAAAAALRDGGDQ